MFSIADIVRFQFGRADSIRRVLESRWSLLVGAILVVTAGIARHYDQKYLIWEWWLPQPFIIVLVSSFAIFFVAWNALRLGRQPRESRPNFLLQYLAFLGAFLMTTPLAWLYAIPFEQWFSLETAARLNIGLLGIVSFWRVALMTRVLTLVTRALWLRCLAVVLLPASVEAMFLSNALHMQLVGIMGGVQLPPHEEILANALNVVFQASFFIAIGSFGIVLALWQGRTEQSFPPARAGVPRAALVFSIAAVVAWSAYAYPWQLKQYRRYVVDQHLKHEAFREALDYLARFERRSFPSPGSLPPDPWDPYKAHHQLIGILTGLQESDPQWLRDSYYANTQAAIVSRIQGRRFHDPSAMLEALVSTPGGRDFVKQNQAIWLELLDSLAPWDSEYQEENYRKFRNALALAHLDLPPLPEPKVEEAP